MNLTVLTNKRENYEHLPDGKAVITMQNLGWVGSNNGFPFGQPALFEEGQANAIAFAVGFVKHLGEEKVKELIPHPEWTEKEIYDYLFGR